MLVPRLSQGLASCRAIVGSSLRFASGKAGSNKNGAGSPYDAEFAVDELAQGGKGEGHAGGGGRGRPSKGASTKSRESKHAGSNSKEAGSLKSKAEGMATAAVDKAESMASKVVEAAKGESGPASEDFGNVKRRPKNASKPGPDYPKGSDAAPADVPPNPEATF